MCGRCVGILKVQDARARGAHEAYRITREAIKAGKLKDATAFRCVDCNEPAKVYDHRDYGKPLNVEAVCYGCNRRRGAAKSVDGYKPSPIFKRFSAGLIKPITYKGPKFKGSVLRSMRERKDLTLVDVADGINVDISSISLWENGRRPGPRNMRKLSDYFKVPISSFFIALFFVTSAHAAADLDRVATAHIGRGETIADNTGPWVERYTGGKHVPWCAGFVSYVLRESGRDLPYTLWARDFARRGAYGKLAAGPIRGEIVVFKRGKVSGHVAIVDQVLDQNRFWIIEGNHGAFPAKVKRSFVDRRHDYGREVVAFVKV